MKRFVRLLAMAAPLVVPIALPIPAVAATPVAQPQVHYYEVVHAGEYSHSGGGFCLARIGSGETSVVQEPCIPGFQSELWLWKWDSSFSSFRLENPFTGECLAWGDPGDPVGFLPCDSPRTDWYSSPDIPSTEQTLSIFTSGAPTVTALDVQGASIKPGARIITWYPNQNSNQKFWVNLFEPDALTRSPFTATL
jgi:hypothetical protein